MGQRGERVMDGAGQKLDGDRPHFFGTPRMNVQVVQRKEG